MNYKNVCEQILLCLGGQKNIITSSACMTRLRVSVRDKTIISVEDIRSIDGVLGVVESDTIQIVFGPGKVRRVLDVFNTLISSDEASSGTGSEFAREQKQIRKAAQNNPIQNLLKRIANIFVPLLPGVISAGLINGLTNAINIYTGGILDNVWWYESIRTLGWAMFAYLPIFAG